MLINLIKTKKTIVMKKMILLFAVLLAFSVQNNLRAQPEDADIVHFTAILDMVYDITVEPAGANQTAWFGTAADYNNGLIEGGAAAPGQINPGTSPITVEATGNWDIQIDALDFVDGGGQIIPIENLGVYIMDGTGGTGHQNGTEVIWSCIGPASIQLVDNALIDLITWGGAAANAGDISDNRFILHWEMGTPDIVAQHPLLGTMFDQMAAGSFGPGTYTTDVNLTLWTNP
jgi:hypothetical protein